MLRLVESNRRIPWETFTIQDEFAVKFVINVGVAVVSEEMLSLMLGYREWSGIRYINQATGDYEIGYGIGDPDDEQGYTEPQAYADWVGYIRNRQKNLRTQIPIVGITQAAFDALLSLYVDTGTWRTVQSNEGLYDLADAVKNSNWLLVADIISRGNVNPELRKKEAAVVQLGDYNTIKTRQQQRTTGIQKLRNSYVSGLPEFERKQAEFVFYRQFGSFLPGMSQLRQRRIVAQALT